MGKGAESYVVTPAADTGDARDVSTSTTASAAPHNDSAGMKASAPPPLSPAAAGSALQSEPPQQSDFARLGIALFLLAWICLGWTLWLTSLAANPATALNQVMGTQSFEDDVLGDFWTIGRPDPSTKALGIAGFVFILAGYAYLVLKLGFWQQSSRMAPPEPPATPLVRLPFSGPSTSAPAVAATRTSDKVVAMSSARLQVQLSDSFTQARKRKISKSEAKVRLELERAGSLAKNKFLWMKAASLLLQSIMLVHILERGLPVRLVWIFAACVAMSSSFCAVIIHSTRDRWVVGIALADTFVDFFNAILFPFIVLASCANLFHIDREQLAINSEIFPTESHERLARDIADDPTQLELVTRCISFLRIKSPLDFISKVGLNLLLSYRLSRLIDLIRHAKFEVGRLYPKRHPIALPFLFFTLLMVIFVIVSVNSSRQACAHHPECTVHARRWVSLNGDERTKCPCLVLVDSETAPKTFDEWLSPPSVSEKVEQLATTGDLQVLHLVNRRLETLPDALKSCKQLRSLSLVYTDTSTLPSWTKNLTRLERIRIDGKLGVSGLEALPSDLFDRMARLELLSLSSHEKLTHLPSLGGLTKLRSLELERLPALVQVPTFVSTSLERVQLIALPLVATLPDMARASHGLDTFVLAGSNALCCNGFLDSVACDLSLDSCTATTCIASPDHAASDATKSVFEKFATTTCQLASNSSNTAALEFPEVTRESVDVCGGTLYKECALGGSSGMCYNARMQVVSCDLRAAVIAMRRRQIAEHVGVPCNRSTEAWLRCA